MAGNRITLCHLEQIPEGSARGFDPLDNGRDTVFLVRRSGEVYAYLNYCPHQGATLPWRKDAFLNADGTRIVCSAHGAEFDIATGVCTSGAAMGQTLHPIPVTVSVDGDIKVVVHPAVIPYSINNP